MTDDDDIMDWNFPQLRKEMIAELSNQKRESV